MATSLTDAWGEEWPVTEVMSSSAISARATQAVGDSENTSGKTTSVSNSTPDDILLQEIMDLRQEAKQLVFAMAVGWLVSLALMISHMNHIRSHVRRLAAP